MPRKLTLEERKFILKRYWKTENAQDVIRDWNHYFNIDPPTRLAIYKLRDKFDDTGSVADAPRSGRQVCALNKIWLQLLRHMAEAQRNHFGVLVQKLVSNESLYVKYSQNSK